MVFFVVTLSFHCRQGWGILGLTPSTVMTQDTREIRQISELCLKIELWQESSFLKAS